MQISEAGSLTLRLVIAKMSALSAGISWGDER